MEFQARLLKTVYDEPHGTPYFKGTVVKCIMDHHRVAWIKGATHLPLGAHEWEPSLEYYQLREVLKAGLKQHEN